VSGGDAAAPERVNCTLPSHPRYLPLIRALVAETASLVGFDTDGTHRIVLAVTEAFTNVIRHAYGEATVKPIDLEIWIEDDTLRLDLIDYGRFIDPKHIASRPLDEIRPGGLGVHLIKTTMDRVEYRENDHGGTTLTMVKRLPSEKESS
jgi:anti-sigma regulatory factor (Ser/Thr protein kinase)